MAVVFSTINDVLAYIETRVPDNDLTEDQIRDIFHGANIEYGDWIDNDDERLEAMCDAVLNESFGNV